MPGSVMRKPSSCSGRQQHNIEFQYGIEETSSKLPLCNWRYRESPAHRRYSTDISLRKRTRQFEAGAKPFGRTSATHWHTLFSPPQSSSNHSLQQTLSLCNHARPELPVSAERYKYAPRSSCGEICFPVSTSATRWFPRMRLCKRPLKMRVTMRHLQA